MALSQSIPTAVGVPALYWAVLTRVDNYTGASPVVRITLGGFATQAAAQAGADPLAVRHYAITLTGLQTPDNIGRPEIYAFLQTLPEFLSAVGV